MNDDQKLDPRLIELLGLGAPIRRAEVAACLAWLARLRPPTRTESVDYLWRIAVLSQAMFAWRRESVDTGAEAGALVMHDERMRDIDPLVQVICAMDLGVLDQPPPVWDKEAPLREQVLEAFEATMWTVPVAIAELMADAGYFRRA